MVDLRKLQTHSFQKLSLIKFRNFIVLLFKLKGLSIFFYFNLFRLLKNVFRDKDVEEINNSLFVKPDDEPTAVVKTKIP